MKKILLYIIYTMLFIACGPDIQRPETTYILENETSAAIEVLFARTIGSDDRINLLPGERFRSRTLEFTNPDRSEDSFAPWQFLGGNPLIFIFNDDRILEYEVNFGGDISFSEPILRNPLRHGNYEDLGNDNEFLFTITQEDFDAATPCDGPCE